LAGAALPIPSAQAETSTFTAKSCDLILGFRATGGVGSGTNLVVDLGSASLFYNPISTSFTLAVLSALDLVATYGSNWNTRTDLYWGIVGTTGGVKSPDDLIPQKTLWATRAEETPGIQFEAWMTGSTFSQPSGVSVIESMYSGLGRLWDATSTENNAWATVMLSNATGSWTSQEFATETVSFGFFAESIENTAKTVSGYSVSDLYQLDHYSIGGASAPGSLVGEFALDKSGTLTFSTDPALFASVPEPSSFALLGLAGGAFAMRLRRQRRCVLAQ